MTYLPQMPETRWTIAVPNGAVFCVGAAGEEVDVS